MNDFSASTLRSLARKGIRLIGLQALPTGRFAEYDRGYVVDDNGCGRVWTFAQVIEAAR